MPGFYLFTCSHTIKPTWCYSWKNRLKWPHTYLNINPVKHIKCIIFEVFKTFPSSRGFFCNPNSVICYCLLKINKLEKTIHVTWYLIYFFNLSESSVNKRNLYSKNLNFFAIFFMLQKLIYQWRSALVLIFKPKADVQSCRN